MKIENNVKEGADMAINTNRLLKGLIALPSFLLLMREKGGAYNGQTVKI